MANMSYCRFENTVPDLSDCLEAMETVESLSESEHEYMLRLLELCEQITDKADAYRTIPIN